MKLVQFGLVVVTALYGCGPASLTYAEAPKTVVLDGPEVAKLDWNTRSITAADVDGDKRKDLVVINNSLAKIDVLLQRTPGEKKERAQRTVRKDRWEPVLDNSRFEKTSIVTGINAYALAVGDLNGDGRADIAYTGDPDPLTIRYQDEKGNWDRKEIIEIKDPVAWNGSVAVWDVNGDGRDDLVVMTKSQVMVYVQTEKKTLAPAELYALADNGCFGMDFLDVDGDGRKDLIYQAPTRQQSVRVRYGLAGGGFGPEHTADMEQPGSVLQPVMVDQKRAFAHLQRKSGLIELMELRKEMDDRGGVKALAPRIFSTGTTSSPACYAVADFNGDKRVDIAVGDGNGSQVLIYFQTEAGTFGEAVKFPSLSGISDIAAADVEGDGRSELFVLSGKEQLVGMSRYTAEGRMSYPEPLAVKGRPLALAAGALGGEGVGVAYVFEQDRKRSLGVLTAQEKGKSWKSEETALASLRNDPRQLRALDVNQDGRMDLAVFTPGDPVLFLMQNAEGKFAEPADSEGAAKSLAGRVASAGLTVGDVTGDGKGEILIAGSGYARALVADETGKMKVVDQYNAPDASATIGAAWVMDLDGDGTSEIILLDQKSQALAALKRDASGVYRYHDQVEVGRIDLVDSRVMDVDGNGKPDLLLMGSDRFWWIPVGSATLRGRTLTTYETDIKDVKHTTIAVGDLSNDGAQELVAIDARNTRVMEVLQRNERGAWRSVMHFTIFETDQHARSPGGAQEPREVLIDDLTGDGRNDLVLLIHDRVLMYPQVDLEQLEKAEKEKDAAAKN